MRFCFRNHLRAGRLAILLTLMLGLLAGCDSNNAYQRGFDSGRQDGERTGYASGYKEGHAAGSSEGDKAGREAGYANGLRVGRVKGYAAGTMKIVGENWQPSLALGLCLAMGLLTAWMVVKILRPFARKTAAGVEVLGRTCALRLLARSLNRRVESRLATAEVQDQALLEARAKLHVAEGLRALGSQLTDERLQVEVERFLRQSVLVREFAQELDLSIQVAEEARATIANHPDLTPQARVDLLGRLSAQVHRPQQTSPTGS